MTGDVAGDPVTGDAVTGYAAGFEPAMRLALAEAVQAGPEPSGPARRTCPWAP